MDVFYNWVKGHSTKKHPPISNITTNYVWLWQKVLCTLYPRVYNVATVWDNCHHFRPLSLHNSELWPRAVWKGLGTRLPLRWRAWAIYIAYPKRSCLGRDVAAKFLAWGPAAGSEAYDWASAKPGRAGIIGLMLKSYETWGCQRGYLASLGCPAPLGTPVI